MLWIAFGIDALVYAALGTAVVWLGRRYLPAPWHEPSFTIPMVVGLGLMLSLALYPQWLVKLG